MTTNPIRQYLSKAFIVLPLTFLLAPIFYAFLGYHPENPVFPLLVYLWYALFIFSGVTLAFIMKKSRYLAYPVIAAAAFFARNIITLPALNFTVSAVYVTEQAGNLNAADSVNFIMNLPLTSDQIMYYTSFMFVTTLLAGFAGIYYAKKSAVDFMRNKQMLFFLAMAALGGVWYLISGIVQTDENAAALYAVYLGLLAASYFIARNFGMINREIEVYGENGAYNVSGIRRIYAYYFAVTAVFSVVPVILCFIIVPFIVTHIGSFIYAVLRFLWKLIESIERKPNNLTEPELEAEVLPQAVREPHDEEFIIYYILLAAVFALIILFRKPIWRQIKEWIQLLMSKMNVSDFEKNRIINQEIISELPKESKQRSSYRNYLKKSRRIHDISKRFLFAYNYLFWRLVKDKKAEIKSDITLKESLTPEELSNILNSGEIYKDLPDITAVYEDIKYGRITGQDESLLIEMTEKTEFMLKEVL